MNISNSRSLSRLAAVQTLYQYDFNEKMNLTELKSINDMEISEYRNKSFAEIQKMKEIV